MKKNVLILLLDLICFGPPVFFMTPVTNYVLIYSTLLCKNKARSPGGHKKYIPTKLEQNRSEMHFGTFTDAQKLERLFFCIIWLNYALPSNVTNFVLSCRLDITYFVLLLALCCHWCMNRYLSHSLWPMDAASESAVSPFRSHTVVGAPNWSSVSKLFTWPYQMTYPDELFRTTQWGEKVN